MSGRERILTIRLLDKMEKQPAYARTLGLEGIQAALGPGAAAQAETAAWNSRP